MKNAIDNNYFVSSGLNVTYSKEVEENLFNFPLENLLLKLIPQLDLMRKAYPSK